MAKQPHRRGIGNLIAPPRFIAFTVALIAALFVAIPAMGLRHGVMAAFDGATLLFLALCAPMLRYEAERMRISACRNDANRVLLLLITGLVSLVILAAVVTELMQRSAKNTESIALSVATLALCWIFSNAIYALHYAHLFYTEGDDGKDSGGIDFPETPEPDYCDFIYFAFCLGMTFQTSDVSITAGRVRRDVTLHCLAAFVFNLGVIAFTINVLGSGS